jgi:hypothetical protein
LRPGDKRGPTLHCTDSTARDPRGARQHASRMASKRSRLENKRTGCSNSLQASQLSSTAVFRIRMLISVLHGLRRGENIIANKASGASLYPLNLVLEALEPRVPGPSGPRATFLSGIDYIRRLQSASDDEYIDARGEDHDDDEVDSHLMHALLLHHHVHP